MAIIIVAGCMEVLSWTVGWTGNSAVHRHLVVAGVTRRPYILYQGLSEKTVIHGEPFPAFLRRLTLFSIITGLAVG
jgi:hypothetical protein